MTPNASFPKDLAADLARHHRAAFGWALACCRWDRAVAEDVLQSAYLKIVDGRARFGGKSAFRTWLFGVVRRTAAEDRRRRAVGRFVPLAKLNGRDAERAQGLDPMAVLVRSEVTRQLLEALERLPPRQREILHLVFYEDMTIEEAAMVIGVTLGTARTHYERGKKRLRTLLEER